MDAASNFRGFKRKVIDILMETHEYSEDDAVDLIKGYLPAFSMMDPMHTDPRLVASRIKIDTDNKVPPDNYIAYLSEMDEIIKSLAEMKKLPYTKNRPVEFCIECKYPKYKDEPCRFCKH